MLGITLERDCILTWLFYLAMPFAPLYKELYESLGGIANEFGQVNYTTTIITAIHSLSLVCWSALKKVCEIKCSWGKKASGGGWCCNSITEIVKYYRGCWGYTRNKIDFFHFSSVPRSPEKYRVPSSTILATPLMLMPIACVCTVYLWTKTYDFLLHFKFRHSSKNKVISYTIKLTFWWIHMCAERHKVYWNGRNGIHIYFVKWGFLFLLKRWSEKACKSK